MLVLLLAWFGLHSLKDATWTRLLATYITVEWGATGEWLKSWNKLRPWVSRNVLFLGLTSFFTDISAEMVSTILPLYLVFTLRLTPLEFGIVDGLYQGMAALVRVAGGFVADRWRWYKKVAVAGYGLSALSKLGFLVVGGAWTALAGIVIVDRIGKGIRTAPRDALISLSTPRAALATAFGVHRSLDTGGAMLGPLLAFGLLALAPGAFDAIFVVSFCAALIGLGVLTLFVENRPAVGEEAKADKPPASLRAAVGLLRAPRFRTLVVVGTLLALVTMSDGFLYLGLQRRLNFNAGGLALLTTATSLARLLASVLFGALWTWWEVEAAVLVFVTGLVVALVLAVVALGHTENRGLADEQTAPS